MDGEDNNPNNGGLGDQSNSTMGDEFANESKLASGQENNGPEKSKNFSDKVKGAALNSSQTAQRVKRASDNAKKITNGLKGLSKGKAPSKNKDKETPEKDGADKGDSKKPSGGGLGTDNLKSLAKKQALAYVSGGLSKALPGLENQITAKRVGIALLAVVALAGSLVALFAYVASNPLETVQKVLTSPKVEEFKTQSTEAAPDAEENFKKYSFVDYKPGTAIAANTINKPKPGSLAEKMLKVNYKTAAYTTRSAPDCPIKFTYKTITNGEATTEVIDKAYNRKGEEVPKTGYLYNYCLLQSMPLYNMMVRTQKARDTNEFSGTVLNYADSDKSPNLKNKTNKEVNDYVYEKTYNRITSKGNDKLPEVSGYTTLNENPADGGIDKYINEVRLALKEKRNPDSIVFPIKNPKSSESIVKTLCAFSDNYLSRNNIKKTIGSRLNTGQRSGVKWNTLASTREVGDVTNQETGASLKQLDGWTSSAAYSQNVYGELKGVDINPENLGNSAYGADYTETISLLINLKKRCGLVEQDGFFNDFKNIFGAGTNIDQAKLEVIATYDALRLLIVKGSNGKFKKINDFGLEQLIISVIRIGGGSAVSGLEQGDQNFNNQSQGFRALSNQYTMQMGGRFLTKEESAILAMKTENTRVELEKKNGIAYRLFDKDNIRSIANLLRYESPRTPNEIKIKSREYLATLSNPIKIIADLQNTIGYIATGSKNTAFAAGEVGDAYMKLDNVGVPVSDFEKYNEYDNSDEIQDLIANGTAQQKEVLGYFDKCSKSNIPTSNFFIRGYPAGKSAKIDKNNPFTLDVDGINGKVKVPRYPAAGEDDENGEGNFSELGFANRKEVIACELYLLPNRQETIRDLGDNVQKNLFGFNISELAKKYRLYLYSNSIADIMVELSNTNKTEAIYANSAALAGNVSPEQAAINTTIVSGDTSKLACTAGKDAGVGDGYQEGKLYKIRLCNVQGIVVNAQIAGNVDAMLNSARSAGINLSGGGFRTMESQIRLRSTNGCPDTYNAKASSCRTPTARPGYSNHQMGLAIDIISNGGLIRSRSNPGFVWLNQNAGNFGLKNLPSEPWHWSVNGK